MQVFLQHNPPYTFYQHSNHTKCNLICIYKAINGKGYPRPFQFNFIMAIAKSVCRTLARSGRKFQLRTVSKAQVSQLISQSLLRDSAHAISIRNKCLTTKPIQVPFSC